MAEISIIDIRQGPVGPAGPAGADGTDANVTQANIEAAITDKPGFRAEIEAVGTDGTGAESEAFRGEIEAAKFDFYAPSVRADRMLVIMTGQSLSVGNNGQPALSVSPLDPYSLTFTGGVKSTAAEMTSFVPLDEDNDATAFGETAGEIGLAHVALRYGKQVLASYGIAPAEAPAVVAVTVGRGSYDLAGLRKGDVSGTYDLLEDAITNFESIATADGDTSEVLATIFRQGESDNSTPSITRAAYATSLEGYLAEIDADAKAATGQKKNVRMVSYQTSAGLIGTGGSSVATLGQMDVLYRNDDFTIAAPVYPIYGKGYYNTSDGVHLTNFGYGWLGAYEGRSLAKLAHGEKPWPLCPLSATARGQIIDVVYRVPSPPLVVDTTNVPSVADYGFSVADDTGALTILSVALLDDTTVRITVDRDLDANPVVRYALTADFTGSSTDRACAGNLRDSDTETVSIAGRVLPLYNWAIHSETEIVNEGGVTRYYILNTDATSYADRLDNYDATVIGSSPTFTSTHAVIQRSASLDTNIAPGAEFTALVVWQYDTSQDTVLFGNFGANLAAQNGAMLLLSGASGTLRLYRKAVISTPSAPQVLLPASANGQWCVAAVSFKADEVIVYCPQSNEGIGRVTGSGFVIDSSPTMAIGGARYTQSHAGTCKIAAVMMSDQFLTTPEIDAHIEILRGDLADLGISF